ncbi:hypothetical protein BDV29DRAFT_184430 [Aspergillus leporis]|uniref:Uncharacterized protein n=1 Tax=Aspergillus leporis TaxID=41062 RepID=A0A5N5WJ57_9EURO|nr:hypothetical protein BDV29DRAFT_184430 [Aspergillus leporis]
MINAQLTVGTFPPSNHRCIWWRLFAHVGRLRGPVHSSKTQLLGAILLILREPLYSLAALVDGLLKPRLWAAEVNLRM